MTSSKTLKVIGLDVSFRRTGIALLDFSQKKWGTINVGVQSPGKSFTSNARSVREVSSLILRYASHADQVFMEEPFPGGEYSSGLYSLDTYLYLALQDLDVKIITYNPTTLKHIMGHRNPKKSESVALAKSIQSVLKNNDWSTKDTKRFPHDEAEAFIYAIYGSLSSSYFSGPLSKALSNLSKAFKEVNPYA